MGTTIILLSDGTGNTPNKVWRTNVWRTFQSLDRASENQLAYYDDGVGTSSFIPLAIIGGVFGWGLKRNVINLYKFVCRNYKTSGDQIYAFGFSRGAFTIRTLIEIIASEGLVNFESQAELDWKAKAAYRAHRSTRSQSIIGIEPVIHVFLNWLSGKRYLRAENRFDVKIRFVGLWDTVAAYGLPVEPMTRALNKWFWPLDLPTRELPSIVQRACHALSLDDERKTFHPILWNERAEQRTRQLSGAKRYTQDERISQVWFAGSHANVGGGYPDDSLAHVSLCWILDQAVHCGLKLKRKPSADPDAVLHAASERDTDGRIYDSRKGLRGYYRYAPRKLSELCQVKRPGREVQIDVPKIHESVFKRKKTSARIYAPIGLPEVYEIVTNDGQILSAHDYGFETLDGAKYRSQAQEKVWDLVWLQRLQNLATVFVSVFLLLYPLFCRVPQETEFTTALRPISDLIRIFGAFLPAATDIWISTYASDPSLFLITACAIIFLHSWGKWLKVRIVDLMATGWNGTGEKRLSSDGLIYRLRTNNFYKRISELDVFWPDLLAIMLVLLCLYISAAVINRMVFYFQDAAGFVCKESSPPPRYLPVGSIVDLPEFHTSNVCQSMGVSVERGERYQIALKTGSFADDHIHASRPFSSFDPPELKDKLVMLAGVLQRRILIRPWFTVVLRFGGVGAEEYFLEPAVDGTIVESFRPSRSGELFMYVNDAIVGWPGYYGNFYANNQGVTKVRIQRR